MLQAAPLSAVGLAADQERVVGLAADQERVVGLPADQERVVGLPADQERVVGLAADQERVVGPSADQERVVESSPHLPTFAQGGASMQPRAAWIGRQAAAVRGAALPVDRYCQMSFSLPKLPCCNKRFAALLTVFVVMIILMISLSY